MTHLGPHSKMSRCSDIKEGQVVILDDMALTVKRVSVHRAGTAKSGRVNIMFTNHEPITFHHNTRLKVMKLTNTEEVISALGGNLTLL